VNKQFKFKDITGIIPYLSELGISAVYLSPYLQAKSGSLHGYDIINYNAINPEIGSSNDHDHMVDVLKKHNMGNILDFVPNHMGVSGNLWWHDVLENGPSSPYSGFFDIDWTPVKAELNQKVLLPVLEDLYGKVLENGFISIAFNKGSFFINYRDHKFPVDPKTYAYILQLCLEELKSSDGDGDKHLIELQSIITACNNLPDRNETDIEHYNERKREKEVIKRRLNDLYSNSSRIKKALQTVLKEINGIPGNNESYDYLHRFLESQVYRLSFWRVAGEEINYRRFFDINELVAVTMENFSVFEAAHKMVLQLLASGKISGLRIDHVDGLFLPAAYLKRLQKYYFIETCLFLASSQLKIGDYDPSILKTDLLERLGPRNIGTKPASDTLKSLYIVVEKILGDKETIRSNWPVEGTTGYEFACSLNGIYINKKNATAISNIYKTFTGNNQSFHNIVYDCKNLVLRTSMASELNMLAHHLNRISESSRLYRDLTLNNLRDVIREVIACFPVYRTYIDAFSDSIDENDRSVINIAVAEAKKRNATLSPVLFDFLKSTLLLQYPTGCSQVDIAEQRLFVMRFQQFTGPVMAKGMEDTSFYVYNPLISLNDVGGNPHRIGNSVEDFHKQNINRLRTMPNSLIATSTHDSKRGEDVRARINLLSEIPQEWKNILQRWNRINRDKKKETGQEQIPDRNEEYYLYQTILGSYPLNTASMNHEAYTGRIQRHMQKALREAKVHTSWISPNTDYEEGVTRFIASILNPAPENLFLNEMESFQKFISHCGVYNSLSQHVLKLFSPGIPDIYQGNETFVFNLTDPDNRRPVDFPKRISLFKQIKTRINELNDNVRWVQELLESSEDSRIKLYVTWKSLNYRRDNEMLFKAGTYTPVQAIGKKKSHVCSFIWQRQAKKCLIVAPVLLAELTQKDRIKPLGIEAWGDTRIILPKEQPGHTYRDIFTEQSITTSQQADKVSLSVAEILNNFPVSVLNLTG